MRRPDLDRILVVSLAACTALLYPHSVLAYVMTSYASRLPASLIVVSLTSVFPVAVATIVLFRYEQSWNRRIGMTMCSLSGVTAAIFLGPGLSREAEINNYRASILLVSAMVPISISMIRRLRPGPKAFLIVITSVLSVLLTSLIHEAIVRAVNTNWDRIHALFGG
jgi:hypothetical protein